MIRTEMEHVICCSDGDKKESHTEVAFRIFWDKNQPTVRQTILVAKLVDRIPAMLEEIEKEGKTVEGFV